MIIKLPEIYFSLPEWEYKRDFAIYDDVTNSLKEKTKSVGFQSLAFLKSSRTIFTKAREGLISEIPSLIKKSVDVRALTKLWITDGQLGDLFFKNCPVTEELLRALYRPRPILSKLVIQQLLRLFFNRFDEVGDIEALILCLHTELDRNAKKLNKSDLAKLIKNRKKIVSLDGPAWIAKQAIKKQTDLDAFIDDIGLNGFIDTRFYSLCQNHYYLEQLRTIKSGDNHPILKEIIKPAVYESPYKQTEMLGHEILRILIDRSPKESVDEQWQGIILTIAGDPRIAKASNRFQLWWGALGENRIKKVKAWLSKFNLMLFLKVLEDLGRVRGNAEMNRMFPARKKFLEGLYDLGLIEDSRLFINFRETGFLKKNYSEEQLPEYATVKTSLISLIYLKVGGKYIVEGTHNFKLWIFDEFDEDSPLLDYSINSYNLTQVRYKLESQYSSLLPNAAAIVHAHGWQHKAIDAFNMLGITIPPEMVLIESEYKQYKRKYGLSTESNIVSSSGRIIKKRTSTSKQMENNHLASNVDSSLDKDEIEQLQKDALERAEKMNRML